ncbi:hypothetical protein [Aeoliella sp.]|uniref:hypothetical protein n=1 Tax=Aeoliella sp. TaxID=2795800 RepID=UPI003CCB97AE
MNNKQAIEHFAQSIAEQHPQCEPWLGDYTTDFETQILIDKAGLDPCYATREAFQRDKPSYWVDTFGYEHRDIRIPQGSFTNSPSWRIGALEVRAPITDRFELFGTSGWNWQAKQSHWVGFDFDNIANHSEGLAPEQLDEVLHRALELPYVVARTSKSGRGIHLLVYLNPKPTTRNHHEHSDLAKHVLGQMSRDTGFDFHGPADCCGLILWHWKKGFNNDCFKRINI